MSARHLFDLPMPSSATLASRSAMYRSRPAGSCMDLRREELSADFGHHSEGNSSFRLQAGIGLGEEDALSLSSCASLCPLSPCAYRPPPAASAPCPGAHGPGCWPMTHPPATCRPLNYRDRVFWGLAA